MSLRLEIAALPPSQNVLRRGHWSVRSSSAKEWRGLVAAHARTWRVELLSARVIITYYGRKDADNANSKPILDGLVDAHVLHDDRYPWLVELVLRQRPAKKLEQRTVVEVEAVEP